MQLQNGAPMSAPIFAAIFNGINDGPLGFLYLEVYKAATKEVFMDVLTGDQSRQWGMYKEKLCWLARMGPETGFVAPGYGKMLEKLCGFDSFPH